MRLTSPGGPFEVGKDYGTGMSCRYALVGTVAVPILGDLPGAGDEPCDHPEVMKEVPELPELEDDAAMVTKEEAQELNCSRGDAEEGEIAKSTEAMHFQNLTVVDVMQDRSVGSIVQALSKVYAKFRSLGVQVFRLHSDREKSFMARPVQRWCQTRDLLQSMTGGDDAKSNGRVESEVQQIKRRTRVLLHESGLPHTFWVCALRHAAEQRLRAQLHRLGVITRPMLRFASTMSVKTKRWHRSGQLSNPFRSMQILGPQSLYAQRVAGERSPWHGSTCQIRLGSSRRRRSSTT